MIRILSYPIVHSMYLQREDGTFAESPGPWTGDSLFEDTGALLFDANGDGIIDRSEAAEIKKAVG